MQVTIYITIYNVYTKMMRVSLLKVLKCYNILVDAWKSRKMLYDAKIILIFA